MARQKRRPPALLILAILAGMVFLYVYGGDIDLRGGLEKASSWIEQWASQNISVRSAQPSATAAAGGEGALEVAVLSVGQADAILITVDGKSMLLDAGESDTSGDVCDYIESRGILKLDYIVCTHPHTDHIGGMPAVIARFEPEVCYVSPREHTTATYEKLMDALEEYGVETVIPKPGDTLSLGSAQIEFLAPIGADYEEINDFSLVFMLTCQGQKLLFTGDAESVSEADMLDKGYELEADFLKVGHHGSKTSSSAAFIEAVSPKYAVITRDNADEVSDKVTARLKDAGAQIFYTFEGDVLVRVQDGVLTCQYAK